MGERRFLSGALLRLAGVAIAVVAGAVATSGSPAGAGGEPTYDLPREMAQFWATEAGQDLIAEYTIDPSQVQDPMGDFEFSTGESPGLQPTSEIDILSARTFAFVPPDGPVPFFESEANGGIFCESDSFNPVISGVRTFCPSGGVDPGAFENGALVSVIETSGDFGFFDLSRTCEWVVWSRHPGSEVFQELPQYPFDPARGTDSAVGLRAGPDEFGPFSLELTTNGSFGPGPAAPIVAIGMNQISFFSPLGAAGVPDGGRAYTFCTEGGYQAADSVADSTSFFDIILETEAGDLVLRAPPPTTTTAAPTTTVAPTTTAASTTVVEATTPPSTAVPTTLLAGLPTSEGANTEGGSFSTKILIPIVFGGLVILVAVTLYWRTRERRRRDVGGTRVRDPKPPSNSGGQPTTSIIRDSDDHGCDWALYVSDGGVRTLLRPAHGHECCVYEISLHTGVWIHDEAARGRQDASLSGRPAASPDDRLRLPDLGWGIGGGYLWGWASARSGPAGRLDWMQGSGDPRERVGRVIDHTAGAQHEQQRTLEEGPDVAAHLSHLEWLDVNVDLSAGCPNYENRYQVTGNSVVSVEASHECTNAAPGPECPIEFTAAATVEVTVIGDLVYATQDIAGSDVDEIEPIGERLRKQMELSGPVAMTDSHDHVTKARDTITTNKTGTGASVVTTDQLAFSVLSGLTVDAGVIVPVATWPTTERVTADVYGDVANDIVVDGHMDPHDCGVDGCGGHGQCMCHPMFSLRIRTNVATLDVDGTTYTLRRPMPEGTWELA